MSQDDHAAYVAELRSRASVHGEKGHASTAAWFRREADKIEKEPAHAKVTRGILGVMRQAAPLLKEGKI